MTDAADRRGSPAVDVLRRVHRGAGVTRADLTRELGLSSGSTTEIVARLRQQHLLEESPAPPTGSRGRPTTCVGAHPAGPLVAAVGVEHTGWTVNLVQVGGGVLWTRRGTYRSQRPQAVLGSLAACLRGTLADEGPRVRAIGVSVAGAVQDESLAQIQLLGWRDVDVRAALSGEVQGLPVIVANDATLGGLAEARRGAGSDASTLLHLRVAARVGGVIVESGEPVLGARGTAGEFGHLPMGDPTRRCPCGAKGCWGPEVDGTALARALGITNPADPLGFWQEVTRSARDGDKTALVGVRTVAAALGSGIGGLVNALDPDVVTLAGLAADVLELTPKPLHRAYVSGLMAFRRDAPPPLRASVLGVNGSLVGAAEAAFDRVLTESGLEAWNRARVL